MDLLNRWDQGHRSRFLGGLARHPAGHFPVGELRSLVLLGVLRVDKLAEVETAKELMTEAMSWSVMKWLREKKRVRQAADRANAALDRLSESVKTRWNSGLKAAYEVLVAQMASGTSADRAKKQALPMADPEATLIVRKVKEADDEAYRARMDAEKTFDDAERQLSTSLAREGCRKAIQGWELHEKAIRKAEAVIH